MPITTLLFDLDGTLVDSSRDLATAVNLLRADLDLPPLSLPEVEACIGDGARLLVERTLPPGRYSAAHLAAFLAHYRRNLTVATRPYPGIIAGLELFARQGLAMAVVTNKPADLSLALLDALDLRRFFPVVIGGDTAPTKKPDPAPVALALAQLNRPAGQAVMIGDHANDLLAGRAAGTRTCFCRWGLGDRRAIPCDWQADSPAELPGLLAMAEP